MFWFVQTLTTGSLGLNKFVQRVVVALPKDRFHRVQLSQSIIVKTLSEPAL